MSEIKTTFRFTYNLKRDLDNYTRSVITWQRTDHGMGDLRSKFFSQLPQKLQQDLNAAETAKAKIELVKNHLAEKERQDGKIYKISLDALSRAWALRQDEIIKRLEKLYERSFDFEQIDVNLTTLPIRPYNFKERYLMVSFQQSLPSQLKTIVHELFHFMLHAHYDTYLKDKVENFAHYEMVKEALTVFINTDFLDLVMVPDKGYPKEQPLREELMKLNRSKRSFRKVLDKTVILAKSLL